MDYSLLVGIHNCDNTADQPQPLDLGDNHNTAAAAGNSSDEHDSSGSAATPPAATPPESPLMVQRGSRTVSFTAELDGGLEFFAIKSAECECRC